MKTKLGIISNNMSFAHNIKNLLKMFNNIVVSIYKSENTYDVLLIDYSNSKLFCDDFIDLNKYNKSLVVIVSNEPLLKYKQHESFITPIVINSEHLDIELLNILKNFIFTDTIIIKSHREYYKLHYYDILMVYPENHYLNFVLDNKTIKSRMTTKEVSSLLESHGFAITSASTYVNLCRIKSISKSEVILDDGKHTHVSRYKYKALIKKFKEEV